MAAVLVLAGLPGWALGVVLVAALGELAVPPAGQSDEGAEGVLGRAPRLGLRGLVAAGAAAALFSDSVVAVLACGALALLAVVAGVDGLERRVRGLRNLPVARGIAGLRPHPTSAPGPAALLVPVPEIVLGLGALGGGDRLLPAVAGGAVAVAVATGTAARWALRIRALRAGRGARLRAAQAALDRDRPEVVLYYGDVAATVHEVAMWLPTLEELPHRAMILVRNREAFDALPPTTSPVLCVPSAQDLLSLRLDVLRVGLFVSNIGNNIHLLRHPGLRTAFVGHGDSDKSASANPFSKVYDQVWVAGPAGRERYARAAVGVRPDALVEVGRPQLGLVRPAAEGPAGVPTLLYAPTWEGWNAAQDYTSVAVLGEQVVRAVLASPTPVRLIYRPHPYAGRRDARVAAASRRIVRLLEGANAAGGHDVPIRLAGAAVDAHEVVSAAERERRAVAAGEQALAARPAAAHVVVPPGSAPLASCFNAADGMVTDVSSVLSDFLARDRPLAVCDPRGVGPAFLERYPAARAGLLLGPEDHGRIEDLLRVVTGDRPDATAADRARVRDDVLGAGNDPAAGRFAAAVSALAARQGAEAG